MTQKISKRPLTPAAADISRWTDTYLNKTREIVGRFGDKSATYAVFMRRPVIFTPGLMVEWLEGVAKERGVQFQAELNHAEGDWVGAGEPLLYLTGPLRELVDLETLYLQKLGAACVAALQRLYHVRRHAQGGFPGHGRAPLRRHGNGGTHGLRGRRRVQGGGNAGPGPRGSSATPATPRPTISARRAGLAPCRTRSSGLPARRCAPPRCSSKPFPDDTLTVLVDYYGQEITDSLAVCRHFPELIAGGRLSLRIDTHGGRFVEGLGPEASYAVLERHVPQAVRRYRNEMELRYLTGTGVSAAAIFHLREHLDKAGFESVKIVVSSGFNVEKCKVMGDVGAPIDVVGTGSYLPDSWRETYATADIVAYDGVPSVKKGREFLLRKE